MSKLNEFFKHYTKKNSKTFLNNTESAIAAKYKCNSRDSFRAMGSQSFARLSLRINKWLDEVGLSDNALKIKMFELLECKETKLITIKGEVKEEDLPDNCQILTITEQIKYSKDGDEYTEYHSLIAVNMDAKEIQRRTLDMAIKVKGMNAPSKHEISGPEGKPIEHKYNGEELLEEMKRRGLPIPETE